MIPLDRNETDSTQEAVSVLLVSPAIHDFPFFRSLLIQPPFAGIMFLECAIEKAATFAANRRVDIIIFDHAFEPSDIEDHLETIKEAVPEALFLMSADERESGEAKGERREGLKTVNLAPLSNLDMIIGRLLGLVRGRKAGAPAKRSAQPKSEENGVLAQVPQLRSVGTDRTDGEEGSEKRASDKKIIPLPLKKVEVLPKGGNPGLRPFNAVKPRVLAIGSSTGGPVALTQIMRDLGPYLKTIPILITQHMLPIFVPVLASNLSKASGLAAFQAEEGMSLKSGTIYIARGDSHLVVKKVDNLPTISLDKRGPVNYCASSIDPMFESVADYYGSSALGVILTGMGSDGAKGCLSMADYGGNVIVQDEESSTVWGMPRAASTTGACCAIRSLSQMSRTLKTIIMEGMLV